jgi:hypothetical protein
MSSPDETARIASLHAAVLELQQGMEAEALRLRAQIETTLPKHRSSAPNLAHYVGVRKKDLRGLQLELAAGACSADGCRTFSPACKPASASCAMTAGSPEWSRR